MTAKKRKKKPSPPWYFYLDTDDCHRCKNKNNCGACKFLKRYIRTKGKKRDKYGEKNQEMRYRNNK